jgi:hypothetical protein
MTNSEKSREKFLFSQFTEVEVVKLQQQGLYDKYIKGDISFEKICINFKDQGV